MLFGFGVVNEPRLEVDEQVGELAATARLVHRERIIWGKCLGHESPGEFGEGDDLGHVGADDDVPGIDPIPQLRIGEGWIDEHIHHDVSPRTRANAFMLGDGEIVLEADQGQHAYDGMAGVDQHDAGARIVRDPLGPHQGTDSRGVHERDGRHIKLDALVARRIEARDGVTQQHSCLGIDLARKAHPETVAAIDDLRREHETPPQDQAGPDTVR